MPVLRDTLPSIPLTPISRVGLSHRIPVLAGKATGRTMRHADARDGPENRADAGQCVTRSLAGLQPQGSIRDSSPRARLTVIVGEESRHQLATHRTDVLAERQATSANEAGQQRLKHALCSHPWHNPPIDPFRSNPKAKGINNSKPRGPPSRGRQPPIQVPPNK
jgi:hypothetical protein